MNRNFLPITQQLWDKVKMFAFHIHPITWFISYLTTNFNNKKNVSKQKQLT